MYNSYFKDHVRIRLLRNPNPRGAPLYQRIHKSGNETSRSSRMSWYISIFAAVVPVQSQEERIGRVEVGKEVAAALDE